MLTHKNSDKNVFKVPTLRNISKTAPYFHNAKSKTLKEAIGAMGIYNLGIEFDKKEIEYIEKFLKTLDGKLPEIINE
jgi:cytochrome c peroxidase